MDKVHMDDFLTYRALSDLAISPGGEFAAYLVRSPAEHMRGYVARVALYDILKRQAVSLDEIDAEGLMWHGTRDLLLITSQKNEARCYTTDISLYNVDRSTMRPMARVALGQVKMLGIKDGRTLLLTGVCHMERSARIMNRGHIERQTEIAKMLEEDERFTVFQEFPYWHNGEGIIDGQRRGLYAYHMDTGELEQYTEQGLHLTHASYNPDDGVIAFSGFEDGRVRHYKDGLYVIDDNGRGQKRLIAQAQFRIDRLIVWDHKIFLNVSMECAGAGYHTAPRLLLVDWHDATIRVFYEQSPFAYIGNWVVSDTRLGGGQDMIARGEWLYFIVVEYEDSYLARFHRDGHWERVSDGCGSVDMFDLCADGIFCVAMQDMRLQELYQINQGRLECLTKHNEAYMAARQIIWPKPLTFECGDGQQIHGFVLLPTDYDPGKRYPMILDIHGGPGVVYGPVFVHEMQYWANHGYVVAFCNPRGSGGRGDAFHNIFGKMGGADYEDIMHFVDHVLAQYPSIDAHRLGVTGGSYGGFMTNWIIGHTDRFSAAVSQRSIANHITMDGISDVAGFLAQEWSMSTPWTDVQAVWKASPLCYADRVNTPTLFIHSDEDYRCPSAEAIQMYTALALRGVDTRLCLFKGENHELSRSGMPLNRLDRLREITRWMDHYLMRADEPFETT